MTEGRKKLLFEIAREAGLDLAFYYGIPMIKKQFGKSVTAEDKAVAAEARELVNKGQSAEARKLLVRQMMGWGLYDEQIFDEDLSAVVRAGLCTNAQIKNLNRWLSADLQRRSSFRHSLTLQETPKKRLEVIAEYAKLSNAERNARLTATGKLDEEFNQVIWSWLKTNAPGITREAWDTLRTAATLAGQGIGIGVVAASTGIVRAGRVTANAAVDSNRQLDAWGLELQARATGDRRTWWQKIVDVLFA